METDRRSFLRVCAGCALVGPALSLSTGCALEVLSRDAVILLADHPGLAELDVTVMIDVGLRAPLAITRVGATDEDFVVTGTECSHLNCAVDRVGEGYTCPCHGSSFTLDGLLISGPASDGLTPYAFEVIDGVMTVFAG